MEMTIPITLIMMMLTTISLERSPHAASPNDGLDDALDALDAALDAAVDDALNSSMTFAVQSVRSDDDEYHPSNLDMGFAHVVTRRGLSSNDNDDNYQQQVLATCTGEDVVRDCLDLTCGALDDENTQINKSDECSYFDDESLYPAVPTAFLIGVQKGGTTSLHASLLRHPQIVGACGANIVDVASSGYGVKSAQMNVWEVDGDATIMTGAEGDWPKEPGIPGKEMHFFDWDARWQRGRAFMLCHYPRIRSSSSLLSSSLAEQRMVGLDSTPDYLIKADVPERVASLLRSYRSSNNSTSQGRFLVVLRDPVDRFASWFAMAFEAGWLDDRIEPAYRSDVSKAASEYTLRQIEAWQACRQRHETELGGMARGSDHFWGNIMRLCSLYDMVDDVNLGGLLGGFYAAQLRHWWRIFHPNQFRLIPLSMLASRPAIVANAVTDFLDLPPLRQSEAREHVDANTAQDSDRPPTAHLLNATAREALRSFYEPYQANLEVLVKEYEEMNIAPFGLL